MKKVKWGIIGCGNVTEKKSGPAFSALRNSELLAVMRRTPEMAEDYARRHHIAHWYSNAEELINHPGLDAIYIATPPDSHCHYTKLAAAAGKTVYVEKPMARSAQECREMIEVCQKFKVPLFVAYYRRTLPRFLKIKKLLQQKAIGTIQAVSIKQFTPPLKMDNNSGIPWRLIPEISGGGLFVDLAAHTFDLLQHLLGPIKNVSGSAHNFNKTYPAEDQVNCRFEFENGVPGIGLWNFTSFKKYEKNEIIGSKGRIEFATFLDIPIILETEMSIQYFEVPHPKTIQQPLIDLVNKNILGKGRCPSTGNTAISTNEIFDEILAEYRLENKINF